MVAKNFNYDADFGGNEIQNVVLQNLSITPTTNIKAGRFWYDTANNKPMYHNGTTAKEFGKEYTQGTGISISGSEIAIDTSVVAQKTDLLSYVPTSRTINGKSLTGNISLTASDVGAVPTSRTINGNALSANITLDADDVGALADSTKYGASIDVSLNTTDYKLTISLKDQDGTVLNSKVVDFPIESVVVSGSYDSTNKKVVLTLVSGSTIEFSVADLISGLQSEITSTNKLDADLVDDSTSTNKFVTAAQRTQIGTNASNITTINTTLSGYGNIVTHNTSEFATAAQGALAATACQKITAINGALTASSGVCTWTITNSLGFADVLVQVRNASTGAVVEVAETITASTITIKLNSTSNIAAGTYKAVIIG